MRKKIMIMLAILSVIVLAGNSKRSVDGILLKDSEVYNIIDLHSGQYLKDIIILPKQDTYNKKEVEKIATRLDQLPTSILKKVDKSEIKVKLFQGKLTDNPTASYLKGKTPRGYKNKNITWDSVPGIGGSKIVLVKIGYSEKGKGHNSIDLELHELAHSLDHFLYNGVSYNQKFIIIWKKEVPLLFPHQDYFINYPEEYFAETFAMYYYSDESNAKLKKLAPKTYLFISKLN